MDARNIPDGRALSPRISLPRVSALHSALRRAPIIHGIPQSHRRYMQASDPRRILLPDDMMWLTVAT